MDKNGDLRFYSCVGGYTVIHDYRQYPKLKEGDTKFPMDIDMKEVKMKVIHAVRGWGAKDWDEDSIILAFCEGIRP